MNMQIHASINKLHYYFPFYPPLLLSQTTSSVLLNNNKNKIKNNQVLFCSSSFANGRTRRNDKKKEFKVSALSSGGGNLASPFWDTWSPDKSSPSLSDVLWPALGAFAAMAMLGKMDQILAQKFGITMTIAPLGAVCAVLFITPNSPGARIGCAAIGVLAFTIFGPGWLARSSGLAAALAFMVYTKCTHPPAASLPLLFVDGAKLHHLNYWYALFPGAAGCIIICLIQEIVCYMKENVKF